MSFHYAYIIMIGYMTMTCFSNCLHGMTFMSLHCIVEVTFGISQLKGLNLKGQIQNGIGFSYLDHLGVDLI